MTGAAIIGLLEPPGRIAKGRILLDGVDLRDFAIDDLRHHIGVIFQFFQLLPTLTLVENVMLPMDFCDVWPSRERRQRAVALLDRLGCDRTGP